MGCFFCDPLEALLYDAPRFITAILVMQLLHICFYSYYLSEGSHISISTYFQLGFYSDKHFTIQFPCPYFCHYTHLISITLPHPHGSPSSCYLVLDVLNATDHELELEYTPGKLITMEASQTCRVPVPVERCPLKAEPVSGRGGRDTLFGFIFLVYV